MYPYQEGYSASQQGGSSGSYSQPQPGNYQMMGGYDYYGYYPPQSYSGFSSGGNNNSSGNSSSVRPLYLFPFYCLAYMLETACKLKIDFVLIKDFVFVLVEYCIKWL